MKIYDCITFFNESLQANLRFNILNNYVEKFIVCESKFAKTKEAFKLI